MTGQVRRPCRSRAIPFGVIPPYAVVVTLLGAGYLLAWALYWPATWPAAGIQQPLHYNETYIWPMPWTLHQAAPGVPPPAPLTLHEGDVVRQGFRAAADNLAAVRVWLAGARGGEEVWATLSDTWDGSVAYMGRFRLEEGGAGQYYTLLFPPIAAARGREFTLSLKAAEGVVSARVGYVDRILGRLRLNEYSSLGDLDLNVYHHGPPGIWTLRVLGERLLPGLLRSRVRQFKPAAFKGMTFSALSIALLVGAGVLLWALFPPLIGRRNGAFAALLTLVGLLLAGAIAFRWDVGGMLGLGPRVALRFVPSTRSGGTRGQVFSDDAPAGFQVGMPGQSVHDLLSRLAFVTRKPEPRQVHTQLVTLQGVRRACIAVPTNSQVIYGLHVPFDAELRLGMALSEGARESVLSTPKSAWAKSAWAKSAWARSAWARSAWGIEGALTFQVQVEGDVLLEQTLTLAEGGHWHDVTLDLRPYAGRQVRLVLTTQGHSLSTLPGLSLRQDQGQPLEFGGAPSGDPPSGGPLPVVGLWAWPHVVSERTWMRAYPLAEPPPNSLVARFGKRVGSTGEAEIELLGYEVDWLNPAGEDWPHGAMRLTLYWRALCPIHAQYTAFVHLLDETSEMRGQWDSQPLSGTYPTDIWPPGMVVRDAYVVPLKKDTPPGQYQLAVGLYELATMERLMVYDEAGIPWPNRQLLLDADR